MDKIQASQKIKEVFENPFDEKRFRYFIRNLFNKIEELNEPPIAGSYIPDAFKDHVKQYKRIAKYTDPEGEKLDVIAVSLKKDHSIERARTMQRNFLADYLKRRGEKDAALVAYYTDGVEDWRFSYVRMDYRIEKADDGKVKVKTNLTPARRYSFLVGKNEPSHTAQQQLVPLLQDTENNPTLARIEQAFNIEKVTDEFFDNYRELFIWTKETLDKVVSKNSNLKADFESKKINTVDFSKKLLGQIVFLQFLQKKGWFGVERDAEWGTGSKKFLRELFEKKHRNYNNFFNEILEPLFYEALRIGEDRKVYDYYYSHFNCKIPFLNGGLFDPIGNYDWVHTDITLPNELFSNTKKTKQGDMGNGILDVFDRFNFTVNEDEPLEKEVAIDPELLGKAYEKFNAIRPDNFEEYKKVLKSGNKGEENKFNKQYGVYYTPRDIVHFMCKQSLISYLSTKLSGKVDKDAIEFLILEGEKYIEYLKIAKEKKDQNINSKYKETKHFLALKKYAIEIDKHLANIKVCDPAAGSGAFPVGMMTEIVKARMFFRETNCFEEKKKQTRYTLKKDCIEYSLFGVDIDPGAVEIAKLRLWLSLVVDEENIEDIEALPNLDYKIRQGDSLLSYYHGVSLEPHKRLAKGEYALGRKQRIQKAIIEITNKKREFFSTSNAGKKEAIQTQIDNSLKSLVVKEIETEIDTLQKETAQDNLFGMTKKQQQEHEAIEKEIARLSEVKNELIATDGLPANFPVIWDVDFGEVLINGGFDVVIANPPYVRQEKIKEMKDKLELNYECFTGTSDLYTYFYEVAYNILTPGGFSCFITSNKWMRAKYGEKLRNFFKTKTKVMSLIDFSGHKVFEATVDTNIILFQKNQPQQEYKLYFVNIEPDFSGEGLDEYVNKKQQSIKQSDLSDSGWTLADNEVLSLKKKIENVGTPLKNWDVKIIRGIITGFNEAFIIDNDIKEKLCKEDPKSVEILKPLLRGRDIDRYYYKWAGLWLIKIESGWTNKNKGKKNPESFIKETYPAIYKHLKEIGKTSGKGKGLYDRDDQGDYWWELRDCDYYDEFEKEKIIYKDISEKLAFVYEEGKHFVNNTVYFINNGNKYLLSVLNSKLIDFYYRQISSQLGDAAVRAFTIFIEQLPIFQIPISDQKPFIELVERIFAITNDVDYLQNPAKQSKVKSLECEIDQMVYQIYGLTEEEIKIIEEGMKGNNS